MIENPNKGEIMDSSNPDRDQRLEIIVSGRVQGVGFRYFTENHAHKYGIQGRVKNLLNGDVLIRAIGKDLSKFISEISRGPAYAKVIDVKISELSADYQYEDFRIE